MSHLEVRGLRAEVDGTTILRGVDLDVRSGEVHAIMGPNGSGKSTLSHVLMGRPGYTVTGGTATLDGTDLLSIAPWERAQAGLFLAMQYPTEIEGVTLDTVLRTAAEAAGRDGTADLAKLRDEAAGLGLGEEHLARGLNVDMSGGEKKRNETLQLAVTRPAIAILDELDSGLDVDGLRVVSRRIEALTNETDLGVLAITHYSRLLEELEPDHIHVFVDGRIAETGDASLAAELEETGYDRWITPVESAVSLGGLGSALGPDPFADPLA